MSMFTTILCVRDPFLKKGLSQFITNVNSEMNIVYCSIINEIYNYQEEKPAIIFIDHRLLPNPCIFCLDKITSAFPESKLIAVTNKKLPINQIPYFESIISSEETETEVAGKIYKIYGNVELKSDKKYMNSHLSDRESEILKLVAKGFTNKEIADKLFISTHTVITHRKNISAKLGIKTIAGLTVYAVLNGVLSADEIEK